VSIKEAIKGIRNRTVRSLRPAGSLERLRLDPVGRKFGFDRGTPIDRRYIEAFLAKNAHYIQGAVMEVGDSKYTAMYGGPSVTSSDVLHVAAGNRKAGLVADLSAPETLPQNRVDCFVCTQTLNFIYDFHAAIRGLHRLLRPGGAALVTLAGASQISRYDMNRWGDYWRFTTLSARRSFEDVFGSNVTVATYGNLLAAMAFFQGLAVEDLPEPTQLDAVDDDFQLILGIVAEKHPTDDSAPQASGPHADA
jgi:hypothetical protein